MEIGLVSIGEMAARLGVAIITLRRWESSGKITPCMRTPGEHRRYDPSAPFETTARPDITVLYARVSSSDQKNDLERQVQRLTEYAANQGWSNCETIADLGSGMNCNKRGLIRLIDMILCGRIKRLLIENKHRLLRFGADLLFRICRAKGVEVVVSEVDCGRSFETELARDVLEIITVFSARLYGSRSAKRRNVP